MHEQHLRSPDQYCYYLARYVKDGEVSHLVWRKEPIPFMDRIRFVKFLELALEEITKVEFDTYVEFGFKVTY